MNAGRLDRVIVIERKTVTPDDYGGEVLTWETFYTTSAAVTYGAASERREAAQKIASLVATFRVRATPATNSIAVTDRVQFDGGVWDVSSNVAYKREGRDITAIRAV